MDGVNAWRTFLSTLLAYPCKVWGLGGNWKRGNVKVISGNYKASSSFLRYSLRMWRCTDAATKEGMNGTFLHYLWDLRPCVRGTGGSQLDIFIGVVPGHLTWRRSE